MTTKDKDYLDVADDLTDDELLEMDLDSYDDEDENFDDENWDEPKQQDAPAKKKSSLMTILLVSAAVIVGGGILVTTLGSSPDTTIPQQDMPAVDMTAPSPAVPQDPSMAMNDLASIQDAPPIQDAPQDMNAAQPPQAGFMNNPAELEQSLNQAAEPPLLDTPQDAASLPLPNQNLPSIDLIKKAPTSIQSEELPAPAAALPIEPEPAPMPTPEPTPAPTTVIADAPAALPADASLVAKLDQVMNRLDALEKKQAQAPVAASTSNPDLTRLSAALERLENKVDQLSSTKTTTRTSASSFADDAPIKVNPTPRKKAPAPKKKEPAYKPPAKTNNWVLRSARPGEAMVAKSGQADLKTIRVGDSVVGIGQIKSIAQEGGRWVVQGTSGRISQ